MPEMDNSRSLKFQLLGQSEALDKFFDQEQEEENVNTAQFMESADFGENLEQDEDKNLAVSPGTFSNKAYNLASGGHSTRLKKSNEESSRFGMVKNLVTKADNAK